MAHHYLGRDHRAGPKHWQPRTGLGWEIDHVVGYFVITLMVSASLGRGRSAVGAVLMVFSALLEGLQALTICPLKQAQTINIRRIYGE